MELIETCFLTRVVIYHKCVTMGGSTEHFTTWPMQNTVLV